jgi:hypothetical protein
MAVTWRQDKFLFINDDGSGSAASWITTACNVNATVSLYGDRNIRVRIAASEQGSTAGALTPWLYIQKNGAGGYYSASACSGSGIYPYATSWFVDGDATAQQISTITFVAGTMDEVDGKCGATASIARYSGTEHEYNLHISGSLIANGTYFDFREYSQSTAFTTYTVTGRLTLNQWSGPNTATQAQTAENVTLTARGPTYTLTVQDGTLLQTAEKPTLSYHDASTTLAVADATHLQTSEKVALSAHYVLSSVKDATQLQTVGGVVLSAHYVLASVHNAEQEQEVEPTDITLTNHPYFSLTVGDASQLQYSDNLSISYHPAGAANLTVIDASQLQTSEKVTLSAHYAVVSKDVLQAQTSDNITLTQHYVLTLQDTYQLQNVEGVTLIIPVTSWVIEVQDAEQLQYAEGANPPIYPPDVFSGTITRATIEVTRTTMIRTTSSILKTSSQMQIVKPVIVVKK